MGYSKKEKGILDAIEIMSRQDLADFLFNQFDSVVIDDIHESLVEEGYIQEEN